MISSFSTCHPDLEGSVLPPTLFLHDLISSHQSQPRRGALDDRADHSEKVLLGSRVAVGLQLSSVILSV